MKRWFGQRHDWDVAVGEAIAIQERLRREVVRRDEFGAVRRVAGLDVAYEQGGTVARSAVAVLSFPDLQPEEQADASLPVDFPYIPGLLSFREVPVMLEALGRLAVRPDLLLCDGHGFSHPRRFGLACHLGVLSDTPTIGVAKTGFIGWHETPGLERGAWQPVWDSGEVVGAVLRTRKGVKPIYVSVGHRISLETAVEYVLRCTPQFRLPEALRRADSLARRFGSETY